MQLTVRDAARYLNVSEDKIYGWIDEGAIPYARINDQYRLNTADLLEWATARGLHLSVGALERPPGEAGVAELGAALESGGVHRLAGAHPPEEVLARLVAEIPLPDEADRPLLVDLVLAREKLGSTGIGDGIAIPHVRTPVVMHGAAASLALWYLESALPFDAPDHQPVDTLFFVVSPTARAHLELLSQLGSALHDQGFRAAVRQRAPLPRILEEARRVEARFPRRDAAGMGPR